MRENYPSPEYPDQAHQTTYDTRRVAGPEGSASILASMLEDVLYPGKHSSLCLSRLTHDGETSEAYFSCVLTLPDAVAAPWVTERTALAITHIKKFGSAALKDSFDITVKQTFYTTEAEESTEIVNDYIIDELAVHGQSTFEGAVRRFSFDTGENRVFEEMTEYDAGLLFDVVYVLRQRIEKDAELLEA